MIKNNIRMVFLGLSLVINSDVFAFVHRKNEVIEQVEKHQLQSTPDSSELNIKNQMTQKSASKSRQRMSAGKIAGMVALVLLGAAIVGALLGGVILPLVGFIISILRS